MASPAMHLTIARSLAQTKRITNTARFTLGQIYPDLIASCSQNHADSHYKSTICEGQKKMIDFARFQATYHDKFLSDSFYLGYYLHLVQDAFYRKYLFIDHGYRVTSKKDTENLHHDYSILNEYLVTKYHLDCNLIIPEDIIDLSGVDPLQLQDALQRTKDQMNCKPEGEPFFFTKLMADEYIKEAIELCSKEYDAVLSGQTYLDPIDFSWNLHA